MKLLHRAHRARIAHFLPWLLRYALAFLFVLVSGQAFAQTPLRNFDHVKTGFPLTGVHTSQRCESCHINGVFKGTPKDCASCHTSGLRTSRSNTVKPANHLPTQLTCETCHNTRSFGGAKFNHTGVVAGSCASCHNGSSATGKPSGHIATQATCDSCHKTTGWTGAKIDHSLFTAATNCLSCHNGSTASGKPGNHVATSANCITCHKTTTWTGAKVDHSTFTAATNCGSCHNGATATGKSATHIPAGAVNCISCHTTTAWKPSRFNHTQTVVAGQCSTCHSGAYPPANARPVNHIPYQTLSGVVVTNCDTCHKSGFAAWAPARFHSNVVVTTQCSSCHNGSFPPATGKPNTPIHTGITNCENCHRTTGWAGARVDHGLFTAATNCASCHNGTAATGKPARHVPVGAANCISCHTTKAWLPSRFNHTQVIVANQCSTCHSGAFPPANARPLNHIPYQTLTGVVIANCDTCHRSGFALWAPARFHGSVSVVGQCAGCHTGLYPPARGKPTTPVHVGVTNCESCHRSSASWLTVVFAHSPANAVGTGTCDSCHNGTSAKGKPATHIPVVGGIAKCDSCHRSQTSFVGATMNHSVVTTSTCKSCHNGSYVSQGRTGALAKPVNHIPEMQLLNGASMDCNTCHTGTTSWTTLRMNHNNSLGGGAGSCKACHSSGTNYLGNMQKMALTHRTKTPPAIDCSESGCHRPLGTRGSTYTNWN